MLPHFAPLCNTLFPASPHPVPHRVEIVASLPVERVLGGFGYVCSVGCKVQELRPLRRMAALWATAFHRACLSRRAW